MESKKPQDSGKKDDDNGGNTSVTLADTDVAPLMRREISQIFNTLNGISRILAEISHADNPRNAAILRMDSTLSEIQQSLARIPDIPLSFVERDMSQILNSLNGISGILAENSHADNPRNAAILRMDSTLSEIQQSLARIPVVTPLQMESNYVPIPPRFDDRLPILGLIVTVVQQYTAIFVSLFSNRMSSASAGQVIGTGLGILAACFLISYLLWVFLSYLGLIGSRRVVHR